MKSRNLTQTYLLERVGKDLAEVAVTKTNPKKRRKTVRIVVLILCSAIILAIVGMGVYVNGYENIFPNVSVAGINIGGLSAVEAQAELERLFDDELNSKAITITTDDASVTYNGEELGIRIDFEQSVRNAFDVGRGGNIFSRTHQFVAARLFPRDIPLEVSAHDDTVERLILQLTRGREIAPVMPSFDISGNVLTIRRGEPGYIIDRNLARERIEQVFGFNSGEEVELNIEYVPAGEFGLDELYRMLTAAAIDAYFTKNEYNQVIIAPERPQVVIARDELEEALYNAPNVTQLTVRTIYPTRTREYLYALLFRDVLSSYTTFFNANDVGRSSNVRLATSNINHSQLLSGEEFSYDITVGPRTPQAGFREANIFIGNRIETGFGGGICQPSSTLYAAILYANLEVVERHNHSLPVGYIRHGIDAAVARGVIDLRFLNSTDYPIKIVATSTANSVTIQLVGTQTVENQVVRIENFTHSPTQPRVVTQHSSYIPVGTRRVEQAGSGGFSVRSYRIVTVAGVEQSREFLHVSRYQPMDRIYVINPVDRYRDWSIPVESPPYYDENGETLPPTEPDNQPGVGGDDLPDVYIPSEPNEPAVPNEPEPILYSY
ncbi:MAG: VanW family protein [Oscillospiraceae bacterium]|nr:VanW family protein [Oscillospiraceae bacterium]